jgi:hypothetical protein
MSVHTVSQSSTMMREVTHRTCAICASISLGALTIANASAGPCCDGAPSPGDVPAGWGSEPQCVKTHTCISLNVNRLCKRDLASTHGFHTNGSMKSGAWAQIPATSITSGTHAPSGMHMRIQMHVLRGRCTARASTPDNLITHGSLPNIVITMHRCLCM